MARRKKIGLLFSYNEGWIAGAYYVMNLVHALKTLPLNEMPKLVICATKKDYLILNHETKYPFLCHYDSQSSFELPFYKRIINVINRILFDKNVFDPRLNHFDIDFLYPCYGYMDKRYNLVRKVFWIPDFQEKYYPNFFSKIDIDFRESFIKGILYNNEYVVYSSYTALQDATKYYPNSKAKSFVLPFAVTLPSIQNINFNNIKQELKLPDRYFFCPNQFWQHKNHITVLKAIKILKQKKEEIKVLFSGKEEDSRNKDYVASLKKYCDDNEIKDNIMFLGFLERTKQLAILQNSIAVIQPSLFEGWSTVVEDSKALNKHIIVSDLNIHKEQIEKNCTFFSKENENDLARILSLYNKESPNHDMIDYSINIKQFAKLFINISNEINLL